MFALSEYSTEADLYQRFGNDWRIEYERVYGSLAVARVKAVGMVLLTASSAYLGVWIYRQLFSALAGKSLSSHSCRRRKRKQLRHQNMEESSIEAIPPMPTDPARE